MTANSSLTADTYISPALQRAEGHSELRLSLGCDVGSKYCPVDVAARR
jgi:hypothetical protein